jgi:CO/xanthine dehydrogenase Mo-binding subunit
VKKFGADRMPNGWRDDPTIFISLAEDGTVTVTCHRSEMGQGVRTSIAMVVADELTVMRSTSIAEHARGIVCVCHASLNWGSGRDRHHGGSLCRFRARIRVQQ